MVLKKWGEIGLKMLLIETFGLGPVRSYTALWSVGVMRIGMM